MRVTLSKVVVLPAVVCALVMMAGPALATTTSQASGSTNEVAIPARTMGYQGTLQLYKFLPQPKQTSGALEPAPAATPNPQAPAPGLSLLGTQYVCGQATASSDLVCENAMNEYLTTNTYPPSDYKVYVAVIMEGYGTQPIARMGGSGGSILPTSALVETDYLCTSSYTACQTGQTVTGFRYWYDVTTELDDNWGEIFYAQSTGINNPSTTLGCDVQIQQ